MHNPGDTPDTTRRCESIIPLPAIEQASAPRARDGHYFNASKTGSAKEHPV
jgi:hypothetical protein